MKTVIFDFDGTLTHRSPNIWKAIWKSLGYSIDKDSYFAQLYTAFVNNEFTHQQWCNLTCQAFKQKNMNRFLLRKLATEIKLIDGFDQTMQTLKAQGYSLHIVSGNVTTVIDEVLGERAKYFDSINANTFLYDKNGKLSYIMGTNYDFEGKAKFVKEYKEKHNIPATDITFVGDGDNDEWVYLSGCNTICINPSNADYSNKTIWHKTLQYTASLTELLPVIIGEPVEVIANEAVR